MAVYEGTYLSEQGADGVTMDLRHLNAFGGFDATGRSWKYAEYFKKDGTVDGRRSRYWLNGRLVARAVFKAAEVDRAV